MSDPDNILDVDFDAQMQGLFQQAERAIGRRSSVVPVPGMPASAPDEIVLGEHTISQAAQRPEAPNSGLPPPPPAPDVAISGLEAISKTLSESIQGLPKTVADLRALLEMKNAVSHSMFSALHEELKGYKDGFLLQSVYRPIIRDLVSLYDDLVEIHRQVKEVVAEGTRDAGDSPVTKRLLDRMRTMEMNLEHNIEFILEVLARLEVTQCPLGTGKLDKCKQRAVAVEVTQNPDEDTLVVRSVKRGFLWHERVLRPEEVVVKRFREEARTASLSLTQKPTA